MSSLSIKTFTADDIADIVAAFIELGWNKPRSQYEIYLAEQSQQTRTVFVARIGEKFAGYSTIVWHSDYAAFAGKNIPEIKDLNVLPKFRNQSIGHALMTASEVAARSRECKQLGLGVGLLPDYGSAQRLYIKMGYVPDGAGIHCGIQPVGYSQKISADDDLVLYLSKDL